MSTVDTSEEQRSILSCDPAADEDEDGARTIGEVDSAEAALALAECEMNADLKRWVNHSVLFDEYQDFVQRSRPLGPSTPV